MVLLFPESCRWWGWQRFVLPCVGEVAQTFYSGDIITFEELQDDFFFKKCGVFISLLFRPIYIAVSTGYSCPLTFYDKFIEYPVNIAGYLGIPWDTQQRQLVNYSIYSAVCFLENSAVSWYFQVQEQGILRVTIRCTGQNH